MYCEKCGQQLPDHATFCGKCGERVSGAQNHFQVQEEKPVRAATNNSGGIRRRIIGICLLVGIVIVGGFFFLHRDGEEIQNVESNPDSPFIDESVADIVDVKDIAEEAEIVEKVEEAEVVEEEEKAGEPEKAEVVEEEEKAGEPEKAEVAEEAEVVEEVEIVEVGDIITFGTYERDNDLSNGAEPLKWEVIDRQDDKVLLLSRYVIEFARYHAEWCDITWEESDLRYWLNTTFYESAFDEEEQRQIIETEVLNSDNEKYGTPGGATTYDKVFSLSVEEVEKYFSTMNKRKAKATAYAKESNMGYESYAEWWLRSPGMNSSYAAYVHRGGSVEAYGRDVRSMPVGVRPALWVSIEE